MNEKPDDYCTRRVPIHESAFRITQCFRSLGIMVRSFSLLGCGVACGCQRCELVACAVVSVSLSARLFVCVSHGHRSDARVSTSIPLRAARSEVLQIHCALKRTRVSARALTQRAPRRVLPRRGTEEEFFFFSFFSSRGTVVGAANKLGRLAQKELLFHKIPKIDTL